MRNRVSYKVEQGYRHKATADAEADLVGAFLPDREGLLRGQVPFNLADDSKLIGCGLVKLKPCDLMVWHDFEPALAIQQKADRLVKFEIAAHACGSLAAWIKRRGATADDLLFVSRLDHSRLMRTRQDTSNRHALPYADAVRPAKVV